ncbi:putative HIT-like protein [Roseibaca ekhonensis]|jgi:histidine triad (HIT) family protein|uniref:Putative HIT-like protein n=1 Tax=Roseinatronobacter ekhonensis TaxID=254356 RepID=A0A3B0N137_9RHOB|nr:histidine triad nucleotide-binding protein [Roseibaca ekhonensis]SUZ33756.1 putative HIT-like protein [Roseibaca ekhonensis]
MPYSYDDQNIFAKILRGEIPCKKLAETEHCLAFHDIAPQAPHHVLVIPKGAYVNYDHFAKAATDAEIVDFTRFVGAVCAQLGVCPTEAQAGYRLISNAGPDGMQEVPHLHVHILAGANIGPLTAKRT